LYVKLLILSSRVNC